MPRVCAIIQRGESDSRITGDGIGKGRRIGSTDRGGGVWQCEGPLLATPHGGTRDRANAGPMGK